MTDHYDVVVIGGGIHGVGVAQAAACHGYSVLLLEQTALPASGSAAFKRSREIHLSVDDTTRPRTVAIYGGKLTGYRATAEKVMKTLRRTLPARKPRARTATQPLRPV